MVSYSYRYWPNEEQRVTSAWRHEDTSWCLATSISEPRAQSSSEMEVAKVPPYGHPLNTDTFHGPLGVRINGVWLYLVPQPRKRCDEWCWHTWWISSWKLLISFINWSWESLRPVFQYRLQQKYSIIHCYSTDKVKSMRLYCCSPLQAIQIPDAKTLPITSPLDYEPWAYI